MIKEKTELTRIAEKAKTNINEFDTLILKWERKINLKGWVAHKTLQPQDAQDLQQEVRLNIFERFGEFNPERSNFETWAFNRSRQVTRSWIRKRIRENNPIYKKGSRKKSKDSIYLKVVPIPEDFEIPYLPDFTEDNADDYVKEISEVLDLINMNEANRDITKQTLYLLAENKAKDVIASHLQVTKSKVDANIRRIRKAINLLEEARTMV